MLVQSLEMPAVACDAFGAEASAAGLTVVACQFKCNSRLRPYLLGYEPIKHSFQGEVTVVFPPPDGDGARRRT